MKDPIEFIRGEIEAAKKVIRLVVHIDLLTEAVSVGLSRLITLDPSNAAKYQAAMDALK